MEGLVSHDNASGIAQDHINNDNVNDIVDKDGEQDMNVATGNHIVTEVNLAHTFNKPQ